MYRLPPFGDILQETFGRFFQEWISALVLSMVYGVLSVLAFWPVADRVAAAERMMMAGAQSLPAEAGVGLSALLLMGFIVFLIYSAINVIWVRSALLGRDDALGDGAYGLFIRTLLMVWRQFAAAGWLFVAALVGVLFAWASGRFAVIFIVVVPAALAIMPAVGLAMVGAAVDESIGIRRAIAILGPNIFKLILPVALVLLISLIPAIIEAVQNVQAIGGPLDTGTPEPSYLTFRFLGQTLDALVTFVWLTLSGVVLGHAMEGEEG